MRLSHVPLTGTEGGADLAGVSALLSVSATNGIGMSVAGAPASVAASVTSPVLTSDAGSPAGVVADMAAALAIMAAKR
eukprot:363570-Pyramimonas_sp.AAC.1